MFYNYYIAHHYTIFQKCITLPNGILQNVMLHFYASFRRLFQESTASMQGHFLKLRSFRSTTASIKTLWQTMLRSLEGECPIMFKERATLVNGSLQKVMLHYNSFSRYIPVLEECCIDKKNVLVKVMQCFFKGTSHVCHFPRILRPWKSLAKYRCIYSRMLVLNAVHLISQTNIHDFQKCVTFHNGMLQKVMLRYYMCVRIQHYFNNLQKSAESTQGLPKATFVQSTTALSIRKKLYNLLINTEYIPHNLMQYVRYSFKEYCINSRKFDR